MNYYKREDTLDEEFRQVIRQNWTLLPGERGPRFTYAPQGFILVSRNCLKAGDSTVIAETFRELTWEDLKTVDRLTLGPPLPANPHHVVEEKK